VGPGPAFCITFCISLINRYLNISTLLVAAHKELETLDLTGNQLSVEGAKDSIGKFSKAETDAEKPHA
jgi:hypothetical protein